MAPAWAPRLMASMAQPGSLRFQAQAVAAVPGPRTKSRGTSRTAAAPSIALSSPVAATKSCHRSSVRSHSPYRASTARRTARSAAASQHASPARADAPLLAANHRVQCDRRRRTARCLSAHERRTPLVAVRRVAGEHGAEQPHRDAQAGARARIGESRTSAVSNVPCALCKSSPTCHRPRGQREAVVRSSAVVWPGCRCRPRSIRSRRCPDGVGWLLLIPIVPVGAAVRGCAMLPKRFCSSLDT
jgi:hypothetical protein